MGSKYAIMTYSFFILNAFLLHKSASKSDLLSNSTVGTILSNEMQILLLKKSNDYRSQNLEKPSANMNMLIWSNDLASQALSTFKNKCEYQKSTESLQSDLVYGDAGRNQEIDDSMMDLAFNQWVDENRQKTFSSPSYANVKPGDILGKNGPYNDYTKLIWADTQKIGCGYRVCKGKTRVMVCRIFPHANIQGRGAYIFGEACSKCAVGTTCDTSKKLCVKNSSPSTASPPITSSPTTPLATTGPPTTSPKTESPTSRSPTTEPPSTPSTTTGTVTSRPTLSSVLALKPTMPVSSTPNFLVAKPVINHPTPTSIHPSVTSNSPTSHHNTC